MSKPLKKGLRVTIKSGQQWTLKREKITITNDTNKSVKLVISSEDSSGGSK